MASSALSARARRRRKRQRSAPVATPRPLGSNRLRILVVWALLMLAMGAIASRLVWLQLLQGDNLAQLAQQQRYIPTVQRQLRHPIIDRQGNILAVDRVVYTLYAHPDLFKLPPSEVAARLSPVLETPERDLVAQFGQQPTGIRVLNDLPESVANRIQRLRLDGLELIPQQQRFYPQQQLFAPIIGFVNLDGEAQAGLELAYQDELLLPTQAPALISETAAPDHPTQTATAGLQLTLDSRLQRIAQQELQAVVQRHGAKRGTVMAMDAHSGEILALATVPTYDPNRYYDADLSAFRNWAVSDLYEPGSTFKSINIAIALEEGVIAPDERVNDSGSLRIGPWTIRNHDFVQRGGRGVISITDVLKYSSNIGMVRIMEKMTPETYLNWLKKIPLDQPSGIDLPAEATGHIKDREQFIRSRIEPATTSFGQGFSLSPVKLLQLQALLANGGKLVTPHVIQGLVDSDGHTLWEPERPNPQPIFSSQTSQQVMAMLETVVADGTEAAQVEGYRIGGKTGTAQKAAGGGYGRGRITSFVGILPTDAPRYVVLGIIDEPQGANAFGSTVAAPLVQEVTESLVVLEGLPPTAAIESTP